MKELFRIDLKDYNPNSKKVYRPSSRGIILKKNKIALVYSEKYKYYKFPGGGIENNEDKIDALIREVKEEVGLTVIKESIKEFGSVLRIQKSDNDSIFIQENFYYFCDVLDNKDNQNLDSYELEAGFKLKFVDIKEAIKVNHEFTSDNLFDLVMIQREEAVLKQVEEYCMKK